MPDITLERGSKEANAGSAPHKAMQILPEVAHMQFKPRMSPVYEPLFFSVWAQVSGDEHCSNTCSTASVFSPIRLASSLVQSASLVSPVPISMEDLDLHGLMICSLNIIYRGLRYIRGFYNTLGPTFHTKL